MAKNYHYYTDIAAEQAGKNVQAAQSALQENEQPYIQAGQNAFGLKGTLSTNDPQLANDFYARNDAYRQAEMNAGMVYGNTPQEREALKARLGLLSPQYADYNSVYANELKNRAAQAGLVDEGAGFLGKVGLGALGATTNQNLDTGRYLAENQVGAWDNIMGATLANQQAKMQTRNSLNNLLGTTALAAANYDWNGIMSKPTPVYNQYGATNFGNTAPVNTTQNPLVDWGY
jgi:hypothetical protein